MVEKVDWSMPMWKLAIKIPRGDADIGGGCRGRDISLILPGLVSRQPPVTEPDPRPSETYTNKRTSIRVR
jgi:hypothetical protein